MTQWGVHDPLSGASLLRNLTESPQTSRTESELCLPEAQRTEGHAKSTAKRDSTELALREMQMKNPVRHSTHPENGKLKHKQNEHKTVRQQQVFGG